MRDVVAKGTIDGAPPLSDSEYGLLPVKEKRGMG